MERVYLCGGGEYKPGDPAPTGYNARYDWYLVQRKAGLRQSYCPRCQVWVFPQEPCTDGAPHITPEEQ